jgi:hypothetical protein
MCYAPSLEKALLITPSYHHPFGGEFMIATRPDTEIHPAMAACKGADQYLVAWQSNHGTVTDDAMYARFVNGEGRPDKLYLIDDSTYIPGAGNRYGCNR